MRRLKFAVNRLAKRLDIIDPPPAPAYCHGCIEIVEVRRGEPSPPFPNPCPRCGLPRWPPVPSLRNAPMRVIRLEVVVPNAAPDAAVVVDASAVRIAELEAVEPEGPADR
jgi:hypothetical protein